MAFSKYDRGKCEHICQMVERTEDSPVRLNPSQVGCEIECHECEVSCIVPKRITNPG